MRLLRVACALVLSACSGSLAPDEPLYGIRPGTLVFYQDAPRISVPDSAVVGLPVDITISTYGNTSCVQNAGVAVAWRDGALEVRPQSREAVRLPSNWGCADVLYRWTDTVRYTFTQVGTAQVKVHGIAEPDRAPVVIERLVVVRPRP